MRHKRRDSLPHRNQRHVECDVTDAGIRPENRGEGEKNCEEELGTVFKSKGQRQQVENCGVELECVEKKFAEVVEHLGEEVPEEAYVGREITTVNDKAVGRVEKLPALPHELKT